jgi:C-terminal processing protease CtpA/Prc
MVLTNRGVYSASEDFVLAMRATKATIVGDTTGGGSGNPLIKALPNGWIYRIPRWQQVTPEMKSYEGTGITPDIAVWISKPDSLAKKDTILERAMMEIRQ